MSMSMSMSMSVSVSVSLGEIFTLVYIIHVLIPVLIYIITNYE